MAERENTEEFSKKLMSIIHLHLNFKKLKENKFIIGIYKGGSTFISLSQPFCCNKRGIRGYNAMNSMQALHARLIDRITQKSRLDENVPSRNIRPRSFSIEEEHWIDCDLLIIKPVRVIYVMRNLILEKKRFEDNCKKIPHSPIRVILSRSDMLSGASFWTF